MGDSRAEGLLDIVIGDLDHLVSAIARVSVPSGTEAGDTGYAVPPGNYQGGEQALLSDPGFPRNTIDRYQCKIMCDGLSVLLWGLSPPLFEPRGHRWCT